MPSATLAERRLSIAASAATAIALPMRVRNVPGSSTGSDGVGSAEGSAPMRAMSIDSSSASAVAITTAISEAGSERRMRGTITMIAITTITIASERTVLASTRPRQSIATSRALSPSGFGTSSANGTCCRAMIVAMPTVKPSITGHGMYWIVRPSPTRPRMITMMPPMIATVNTAPVPCTATIGSSTTVIAPVGPET